ncbi:TPA: hypothetical protein ACGO9B_000921 [Streptococcus suis]
MKLVLTSIHTIDRVNNRVVKNEPTNEEFYDYFSQILVKITNNKVVKNFLPKSDNVQVVTAIRSIIYNKTDSEKCDGFFEDISKRLLEKEKSTQEKINRLDKEVQVGSLLQALFYDENSTSYMFLLAKVEHIEFVKDEDLTFQSGFPKDIKIYKSCVFHIDNDYKVSGVQIHLDKIAKYWFDEFLELIELTNDEINTDLAFRAIDGFLNRNMKKKYPRDRGSLRNSFISYFRQNEIMNYDEMIYDIFSSYSPIDNNFPKDEMKDRLLKLPDSNSKKFERNFSIVQDIVKARIVTNYDVYKGITLKVLENREVIKVIKESGRKFLKIPVVNEDTINEFENNQ